MASGDRRAMAMCWICMAAVLMCALFAGFERAAAAPPEWQTRAERSDYRETSPYDETIDFCKRLAAAAPNKVKLTSFGKSGLGRDLPLLIVDKDGRFDPPARRSDDQVIVLIQNGIHAGEIEGKEASLALVRDIVVTGELAHLLDHITLVIMPIFNVDGHERSSPYNRINQNGPAEMGWRVNATNLNLNRDYTKADTPEMQAWLRLWNAWQPDLFFDDHTTNGSEHQYDLLWAWTDGALAAPSIDRWLNDWLAPIVWPMVVADGHLPMRYFGMVDRFEPAKGIQSGGAFPPRLSTGYAILRNRPSILIETHMSKPFETRVKATFSLLKATLEAINRDPAQLRKAVLDADAHTLALLSSEAPNVPLTTEITDVSEPLTFKGVKSSVFLSPYSGQPTVVYSDEPIDIPMVHYHDHRVAKSVEAPAGYLIGPQWTDVIERLDRHDVKYKRLDAPITLDVTSYRFDNVSFWQGSYEGHQIATFKTQPIAETRAYPAGSVFVPVAQPNGLVAVHLLEPDAPDSLVLWGFFNAVFEQKEYGEMYVLEKLAEQMLESDPALREEFEQNLRTDDKFAGDARDRLEFIYRRSPYWDKHKDVYPVARVSNPLPDVLKD